MSRTPRITGSDLIRALTTIGFAVVRVRGSHHFLRHDDGRRTVVPVHSGETMDRAFYTGFSGIAHSVVRIFNV
jgi:predicted RNA binding protein YcfA (HicA-like mRNA interferase family)